LFLKNDNELYCFGTYHDAGDKKTNGRTTGAFSAFLNTVANNFVASQLDIPESTRVDMEPHDKKKAKEGLLHEFRLQNAYPDNNGGIYAVLKSDIVNVTVSGTTGALNTYQEQTFSNIFFYLSKDKKIKWVTGSNDFGKNPEMATRIDRKMYYVRNDQLNYVFMRNWVYEKEPMGLYEATFDKNNGNDQDNVKLISEIASRDIHTVDNTLYSLSDNEFILTTASAQLGFITYKIE
jgi:hypothetical protein